MNITARLIAAVHSKPGMTGAEAAKAIRIEKKRAQSVLSFLATYGQLSRQPGKRGYCYYPPTGTPEPARLGNALIIKSRGFHGVDIDAAHRRGR